MFSVNKDAGLLFTFKLEEKYIQLMTIMSLKQTKILVI